MLGDRDAQVAADTQYALGAFDAIAELLAVMAQKQGLELDDDIAGLLARANLLSDEFQAHRKTGFVDTIAIFDSVYTRGPDPRGRERGWEGA